MLTNISLKDLQLVRLVTEGGSLTIAASRMHVSQPAASQRLTALTDRLGFELFRRIDGRLKPTDAGERIARAASAIDGILGSTGDELRSLFANRSDHIRVTPQCYTCYRWLPFVIQAVYSNNDGLVVDIVPEATEDPFRALDQGSIDVAIVSNLPKNCSHRVTELFNDEFYAVLSDDHPLASRHFLTPANLADETLILYAGGKYAIVEEIMRPAGLLPRKIIPVKITEAIIELARAGQGIAIVSGWAFDDFENRHGLRAVRITRGGFKRQWHAVVRREFDAKLTDVLVDSIKRVGSKLHNSSWRRKLQHRSGNRAR